MPRMDGTGPISAGSMTGRGRGLCTGVIRYGNGRGLDREFTINPTSAKTEKELLQKQKNVLQSQLKVIVRKLETL